MVATERVRCAAAISEAASARNGVTTSRVPFQQVLSEVRFASRRAAVCVVYQCRSRWYQPLSSLARPTPMCILQTDACPYARDHLLGFWRVPTCCRRGPTDQPLND